MVNPSKNDRSTLDELKALLLEPELKKLSALAKKLENEDQLTHEISHVLPAAILKSAQQGKQLSESMVPTVEEIVSLSIKKDINKFASVLFPVIGPAIRKSISETLRQMLKSLNLVLENTFNWQGLKWRVESWRTGIAFEKIVFLNSFIFRVDQVFLIHKKSGLLLNNVEQDDALSLHPDLVSSMLTAIGDFVGDSFKVQNQQYLDSIQVGDFSILLEQGPDIMIAVACRGEVNSNVREFMVQTVEEIQAQLATELEHFKGDTSPYLRTRDQLLLILDQTQQHKTTSKKLALRTKLIWSVIIILFSFWIAGRIYTSTLQHDYVNLLHQEPGYIVMHVDYDNDLLQVRGLRDPLSRDPNNFLALSLLNPEHVLLQFEPFHSSHNNLVKQRIENILQPPKNVELQLKNNALTISGFAAPQKAMALKLMSPLITGIQTVDSSQLKDSIDLSSLQAPTTVELSLNINNGHLSISGEAFKAWEQQVKERALLINGIQHIDLSDLKSIFDTSILKPPKTVSIELRDHTLFVKGSADTNWINLVKASISNYNEIEDINLSQLKNTDAIQLQEDITWIESQTLYFDSALSFSEQTSIELEIISQRVLKLTQLSQVLQKESRIIVNGFSDSIGSSEDNIFLSKERAEFVAQHFFNSGVNPRYIQIKGLESPPKVEKNAQQRALNRKVTFIINTKDLKMENINDE